MTVISNSTTIHRKAKDGAAGQDAVVYTIVPTDTVVPEGTVSVGLSIYKTVGATTTPLTYVLSVKENITLTGEGDAADHVQWNPTYRRLHLPDGAVYGKRYTIAAIDKDGVKVATFTIGVTARGEQGEPGAQGEPGERGQDGTSIQPKGTALRYFSTYTEYTDTLKTSGLYLVSGKVVRMQGVTGAYLYTYNASNDTTEITSPALGESYINEHDGHLYVAVVDPEHPAPEIIVPTSPNGLMWRDVGEIRGVDAISISVEGDNVIFPQTGAMQYVYVDVYRGSKKLTYGTEYTCSILSSDTHVLDGKVSWDFRLNVSNRPFCYRLRVLPAYQGTDISGTIPFTVNVDGVEYHRNINVRTVLNGSRGYNGCLIRRSEWQPGKTYRNDSDYNSFDPLTEQYIIDEVTITDENQNDHAYLVTPAHRGHTSGSEDEAGNLIKPGLPTDEGGWNYDTDNDYYQMLQMNTPIRVPFADIKQAIVDYLQARQIVITDDNGNPYGAFGGGNDWPLWFGGIDAAHAKVRFNKQGYQEFLGTAGVPNIRIGIDPQGYAVLQYFDNSGNELYNLGPDGIFFVNDTKDSQLIEIRGSKPNTFFDYRGTMYMRLTLPNLTRMDDTDDSEVVAYKFREGLSVVGSAKSYVISKVSIPSNYDGKIVNDQCTLVMDSQYPLLTGSYLGQPFANGGTAGLLNDSYYCCVKCRYVYNSAANRFEFYYDLKRYVGGVEYIGDFNQNGVTIQGRYSTAIVYGVIQGNTFDAHNIRLADRNFNPLSTAPSFGAYIRDHGGLA